MSDEDRRGPLRPGDWDGVTRAQAVRLLLDAAAHEPLLTPPWRSLARLWARLTGWCRRWRARASS